MKCRPLDNDSWRVHFSTAEFKQLLESAPHQEARLAMRLMALSLRVGTVVGVLLNQFNKKETPDGTIWTLSVEAKDATDRDGATRPREVWIPEPLIEEIREHAGVDDFTEPKPLFHVSKRTVQNWVKGAAMDAATATGDEDFEKVSSHDFRRYFASHFLYRHNIKPEVVRQLGGWKSPRSMFEYLLLPDDVLADELGSAGLLGAEATKRPADGTPYREENAIKTLAAMIKTADKQDERKRLADRVAALFDDVDGLNVAVARSTDGAERAAEAMSDSDQSSFLQLDGLDSDEAGATYPVATAKVMYVACVVLTAWLVTFGPLA